MPLCLDSEGLPYPPSSVCVRMTPMFISAGHREKKLL